MHPSRKRTRPSPMSFDYVIDSFAWFEYFIGSKRGEAVRRYVEGKESATPTIVIAELSRKFLKEVTADRETMAGRTAKLAFTKASTVIVDLTEEIAEKAGEIDVVRKRDVPNWGLTDSIILATAQMNNAKVVTGDQHFKDLQKEIVFI